MKSPGISLYDPLVSRARADGVRFTSLLNLWFATAPACRTICVTGTKGKSTTTALIAHMLRGVGWNAVAAGNIGVPVTDLPRAGLDAAVIEVSSYQAADFAGLCDIAVLTSLFQEHLDWHGSVAAYRRDKLNLLVHARRCLIAADAEPAVSTVVDLPLLQYAVFAPEPDVRVTSPYLRRRHNLSNCLRRARRLCRAWHRPDRCSACGRELSAIAAPTGGKIGEVDGLLFVDDSISNARGRISDNCWMSTTIAMSR